MKKLAEQAVMDAWEYERIVLDYSPASIEKVEQILTRRQKWIQKKNFSEKGIKAEALILGAYVGEVIRKEHGGTWLEGDDKAGPGSYPLEWQDHHSYPYGWCAKRLTCGPEENVWHKYLYFVRGERRPGVEFEVRQHEIGENAQQDSEADAQ